MLGFGAAGHFTTRYIIKIHHGGRREVMLIPLLRDIDTLTAQTHSQGGLLPSPGGPAAYSHVLLIQSAGQVRESKYLQPREAGESEQIHTATCCSYGVLGR